MTRRQALKSLCAAALAVVAQIPALAATNGAVGTMVLPDNPIDPNAPCPCCSDDVPEFVTVSFCGSSKTYKMYLRPDDGSYRGTIEGRELIHRPGEGAFCC